MDFSKRLNNEFEKRTKDLIADEQKFIEELSVLHDDSEAVEIMVAQTRVLERKIDDAIVEGKTKIAEKLQKELQEVKGRLNARESRIVELATKINACQDECGLIRKQIIDSVHIKIAKEVNASWDKALSLAEDAWEALREFGCPENYRNNFTISDHEPSKERFLRFRSWITTPIQ